MEHEEKLGALLRKADELKAATADNDAQIDEVLAEVKRIALEVEQRVSAYRSNTDVKQADKGNSATAIRFNRGGLEI